MSLYKGRGRDILLIEEFQIVYVNSTYPFRSWGLISLIPLSVG